MRAKPRKNVRTITAQFLIKHRFQKLKKSFSTYTLNPSSYQMYYILPYLPYLLISKIPDMVDILDTRLDRQINKRTALQPSLCMNGRRFKKIPNLIS